MPNKKYKTPENATTVCEPAVAYRTKSAIPPCRMTIDELKTEVQQSVEDARNGSYITLKKARTRIVEKDSCNFELTADMKSILDERLMEDDRLYLSAEDSIKKLNKKYVI